MGYGRHHQLKLFQLQVLITVADCSSFSEAALQLQVSQSAVSYAIASLEQDLGVVLLLRGRFGAQLTPVGEQIVDRARQVSYLLEEMFKQANLARGLSGGHVRISSFRSAATHILPEVIAEFCRLYPAIAVSIADYDDRPDVEEDLRKGRADLGITYLPTSAEFETWDLMRDEIVALFPPDFEPQTDQLAWAELAAYPLIMAPDGDSCDAMMYAHCEKHGISLRPTYQIRSDATIMNMVAKGLGAALSPRLAAEPIPTGVKVYQLPVPMHRVICIAALKEALLTPAAYAFLDLLKNAAHRLQ
ncbi:LysR family transcriptional regulator [Pseudanabaena sp. FACHB-2040]|uniref:LysR family transcriptional regulator n=1 Tax=Pseudanabaena sp. FACHB-2040 TaxID=2692859 RepID=UPI0016829248|nr:LysR family transcriptional regulator [Pseudanabaena sp. FACHB-2040]MBD2256443.1 LysR family transcriptional regulator [Pseudanabaena sp. FACHB-2040]